MEIALTKALGPLKLGFLKDPCAFSNEFLKGPGHIQILFSKSAGLFKVALVKGPGD